MTGADFLFMINNSSWMIKFVMLVLVAMSILSWSLIFFKSCQLNGGKKIIFRDLKKFKVQSILKSAIKHLEKSRNSTSYKVASEGLGKTEHCVACCIRNTVMSSMESGEPKVRVPVKLQRVDGEIKMVISTTRILSLVRIVIEKELI